MRAAGRFSSTPKRESNVGPTWLPSPRTKRPAPYPARSHAACAVTAGERENATATSIPTVTRSVARSAAAAMRYGSRRTSAIQTPEAPACSASAASRSASRIVTVPGRPTPGLASAISTRMSGVSGGFTPAELRTLRALKTPYGVQRFLDDMPYHLATTAWSPRRVLRENTAHCLEAAIFGAAALRVLGFPPLVLDLEAEHDTDHVVAVFKHHGHWGAVAKSNYNGLAYREAIHRTLRELTVSYFYAYFNLRRERTLRTVSRPLNLARFDNLDWMTTDKEVWFIPEYLLTISHTPLLRPSMAKRLTRLDKRSFEAGLVGHRWK